MTRSGHSSTITDKVHHLKNASWPRATIGGVGVVTGAFLAFAWWQIRLDNIEEQKVLRALDEEFTYIHAALAQHLTVHVQTSELLVNLLQTIEDGSSKIAGPIIEPVLLEMAGHDTWDLDDSALEELISAGHVGDLSNRELSAKLSAWAGVIGEYRGDQEIANNLVDESHIPYFLSKNVSFGAVKRKSDDDRPRPERAISYSPDTIRQLLEDPKFHLLTEVRYRFNEHLIVEIEISIEAAEGILAEIDESRSPSAVSGR
jgi:hypothetical protein